MATDDFKEFIKASKERMKKVWKSCPLCSREVAMLNERGNCGKCYSGKAGQQVEIQERNITEGPESEIELPDPEIIEGAE